MISLAGFEQLFATLFRRLENENVGMEIKPFEEYLSEISRLDQILQCWKPYREDSQQFCRSIPGDLAK